ncbi:MAG: NADPH:quinone oxidoreductase family protein [Xanthomonadales bacterium]|uniref:NADPH:quinone oxidoreductase family protein n=1 Tax=Hydrogenophaga sp. TaxID=1904254 RepID=UPI002A36F9FC|nr:NADPH:quinone oxidoreductase family protein [Hydrogenophaga sp.]MCK9490399.1 NADPH:quinone oxidoreductase family protein [Xanthomonadales bacterium]MDX9968785.1 NADPH:quinone oxidoreductase family protein [Hydrogenophaga sp.]
MSHAAGGPEMLVLEERPEPEAGEGELLVRVQAVGVNFPDGLLIRDRYQVKPPRPFAPGGEFCGVVERVGAGVSGFRAGDVVLGRCGWGAMAERIALSQERCVRIPAGFPPDEAAAFLFAYATAYHALHDEARIQPGETLLVLGAAGGVGSAAVDLGRAAGARVLAGASSEAKLAFARSCGAADGLVYDADLPPGEAQQALARRLKALAPGGVDVVFDPVGGAYAEPALRSLGRGGRHLVVGFTAGIPRMPLNLALLKRCRIIGVDWRAFVNEEPEANARNVDALLSLWAQRRVRPQVTEVFDMASAPEAIRRMESRSVMGKLVVSLRH